jgi:class 3 adenylate cyclase/HAMP domain-containing protein
VSIRLKILLIVIPLLVTTLLVTGFAAVFSAETGITRVAIDFLGFKAEELKKNADNQWGLLVGNDLSTNADYVDTTKKAVESFAQSLIRSETELIFALDDHDQVVMSTRPVNFSPAETAVLSQFRQAAKTGWLRFTVEGRDRVAQVFRFDPFGWTVYVSEARDSFYQGVREIQQQNYLLLAASLVFAFVLLLFFSSYLTRPISKMVKTMREIIRDNNLDRRVDVEYSDEIGRMAQTFNVMLAELGRAYGQIKNFALQSVLAQKTEQKIRNIFQKYVPADVIDEVLGNPEAMLVGKNRDLAVLFSDIRGFTTISESMAPDELVLTLNRYFSLMVDVIMARGGTVDKYIGDAVMAIFGAPVHAENDALQSVIAGLEMTGALDEFNADQVARGKKEFHIGIGINFGEVTVGNMGSTKKMNYTVIGDGVNLASRLEGLTKKYKQILLFSESVYQKVGRRVWCRLLDKVVVKGKTQGESIYTAQKSLTEAEKVGWATWHSGLEAYYARDFLAARSLFREVADRWLPGDAMALEFIDRCDRWVRSAPPADWAGVEVMHEK